MQRRRRRLKVDTEWCIKGLNYADLESGSSGTPAIEFHDFVHGVFFGSLDLTGDWSRRCSRGEFRGFTIGSDIVLGMLVQWPESKVPSANTKLIFQGFNCSNAWSHHPCFGWCTHGYSWLERDNLKLVWFGFLFVELEPRMRREGSLNISMKPQVKPKTRCAPSVLHQVLETRSVNVFRYQILYCSEFRPRILHTNLFFKCFFNNFL